MPNKREEGRPAIGIRFGVWPLENQVPTASATSAN